MRDRERRAELTSDSVNGRIVLMVVFFDGADKDDLAKIVRKVLNARVHSIPATVSGATVKKAGFTAREGSDAEFVQRDILIVPQATLAGSVKKGNNPQYHGQVDKQLGADLYAQLCDAFRDALAKLDPSGESKVQVGTYGNRQALKFQSAGPNTHIFEF